MFCRAWAEIDTEKGICKLFTPQVKTGAAVELDKGYLTISDGDKNSLTFRISPTSEGMQLLSAQSMSELTFFTVKFASLAPLAISEKWPENFLEFPLLCRHCQTDAIPKGRKPFLVPSMLWGFEEVRACEECAPMSHGSSKMRRTDHSQRLYVGDRSLFVAATDGVRSECQGCRFSLGRDVVPLTPFLSDLKVQGPWVEIRKSAIITDHLPFLPGYTQLSELGAVVEKLEARSFRFVSEDSGLELGIRVLGAPIDVRPAEGQSMLGETCTRTVRCVRVLIKADDVSEADGEIFHVDHNQLVALVEALENFEAPGDLWPIGDKWKLFYLPLHPEMDD
jgi:hypothetical protein